MMGGFLSKKYVITSETSACTSNPPPPATKDVQGSQDASQRLQTVKTQSDYHESPVFLRTEGMFRESPSELLRALICCGHTKINASNPPPYSELNST